LSATGHLRDGQRRRRPARVGVGRGLKDTFANYAFEHQEIAAYTSLIAMAERIGDTALVGPLRQSLSEEGSMAKFIAGQIVPTAARYMDLVAAGEKAKV